MWIIIYFAHYAEKGDHALQFVGGHMFRKDVNLNLLIHVYLDYLEEKKLNTRIFCNKELTLEQLLLCIKLRL